MTMRPDLAVLIPCLSDQDGLARTLASLANDEEPFDIFVVDDGSPIPLEAPPSVGTHAVNLSRNAQNEGIARCLRTYVEALHASGYTFIGRIDAGDRSKGNRFRAQMDFMRAHHDCAALGTCVDVIEPTGQHVYHVSVPTTHESIVRALHYGNCLYHPALILRTAAVLAAGNYRTDSPACEDYDLIRRLAIHHRLANLPSTHLDYELHPGGVSRSRRMQQLRSRLRVQIRHFDRTSPHSYIGAGATLLAILTPTRVIAAAKRKLGRFPF